jgi:hypothetical protein
MDLQKLNVKFFTERADAIPLTDFIGVFNSWIQASEGAYYDLADYSHVPGGPGMVLVAHEANVSMDNTGDRLGLLYSRKQLLEGSNGEKLRWVFGAALENCRRLEGEPALQGRLKFGGSEALFLINDRLIAPNAEATYQGIKPDLEAFLRQLYAGARFTLAWRQDPRQRFSLSIRTEGRFDVADLLKNLGKGSGNHGRENE